ncbi:MAG: murein biosynthesis integral membrane protein MurJ [Myxococcales bacterium]|nr:murein biosynthesis integral membrane protein MurJ [Myxococcales bacterium]
MTAATLIMGSSILASRLIGFLRERVIANLSGATRETDIYYAAFTIPDFLNYLLAAGAISITFIPIFSGYLVGGDEERGWRVFSNIFLILGAAMTLLVGVGFVCAEQLVPLVAPGFSGVELAKLARVVRIILPAQVFFYLGGLLTAVQLAKEQFGYAALAPLVYNAGIIGGGLLLAPTLGVEGFAWGVLLGAAVGNFAIQWLGARKVGMRLTLTIDWRDPALRQFLLLSLPIMLGFSLTVADEWFLKAFGSNLQAGRISFLTWARTIVRVPVALFGLATGIATFPFLSKLAEAGDHEALERRLGQALRLVIVLSAVSAGLLALLAFEGTYVIFYGWKMTLDDVSRTARVLVFFSAIVVAWGVREMLSRGFYARRSMWPPTLVGSAAAIATLPLYWLFMTRFPAWGFGDAVDGLAFASACGMNLFAGALVILYYRRVGWEHGRPLVTVLGKSLLALAIACSAAYAAKRGLYAAGLPESTLWAVALRTVVIAPLFLLLFAGVARVLRLDDIANLWRRLVGRFRRSNDG